MALQNDDPFAASPPLTHEKLRIAVTARRVRYVKLGYEPIPVLSGRKRPKLDRWQEAQIDFDTVGAWADARPGELSTGISHAIRAGIRHRHPRRKRCHSSRAGAAQHDLEWRHDLEARRPAA